MATQNSYISGIGAPPLLGMTIGEEVMAWVKLVGRFPMTVTSKIQKFKMPVISIEKPSL